MARQGSALADDDVRRQARERQKLELVGKQQVIGNRNVKLGIEQPLQQLPPAEVSESPCARRRTKSWVPSSPSGCAIAVEIEGCYVDPLRRQRDASGLSGRNKIFDLA
jgi:hypothetical protein